MYSLHCTKKLLDRVKLPIAAPAPPASTALGNWYATVLFWKPQVALLVNERTLLPVLMPLAPVATLTQRFPDTLNAILNQYGASAAFVANEIGAMSEVTVIKTANRSVVGTMNEFSFLAEHYRDATIDTFDLIGLAMRLGRTPCGAVGYSRPAQLIKALLGNA